MPAIAAFDTFLRSIREIPYIAPRAGISLQSMACRRRAEVLGSIVKGASFWDDDEGVVNPFSFATFSRCAVCCSFSKVMLFAIVVTEIAKKFRCGKQMLSNLGTISYTCTAPPSRFPISRHIVPLIYRRLPAVRAQRSKTSKRGMQDISGRPSGLLLQSNAT